MNVLLEKSTKFVCNIIINRPSKRNAFNLDTIKCLQNRLSEFDNDDSLRVAILQGAGGNFSSGYDLNEIIDPGTAMPDIPHIREMLWPIGTKLSKNKIVIAAIQGYAAGFAYELALKCDFRIADNDARMGFMNRRFGVPILNGGTVILPKLIGLSRAMDLIATGRAQLAHDALRYGVLYEISDVGCAVGKSLNLARCLIKFNERCLRNDMNTAFDVGYDSDTCLKLLRMERSRSLNYLENCGPLQEAAKFLNDEICRHGNYDLGNLMKPTPQVTL